jgi:hypothetical protein
LLIHRPCSIVVCLSSNLLLPLWSYPLPLQWNKVEDLIVVVEAHLDTFPKTPVLALQ